MNKEFQRAKNTLDSTVYGMISEHRKSLERGQKEGDDLLFTLLQAQDEESGIEKMSDIQLRDEVMTIFLAGHETTSNALTWTLYLLALHPDIEAKLNEELQTVLGDSRIITTILIFQSWRTQKGFLLNRCDYILQHGHWDAKP